jgi:hypothetical protein
MHDLSLEIASQAARLIVEEGLDYASAKRRVVKDMGLSPSKAPMPNNDLLEQEVRTYINLFCADTQPAELLALRRTALEWMLRLQEFRPHLAGAVWRGTATRLNDIHLQLFCDDSKQTEIELINRGLDFDIGSQNGFRGDTVDVLSLSVACEDLMEEVGLHLVIYDHDDLRGALVGEGKHRKSGQSVQPEQALEGPNSHPGGSLSSQAPQSPIGSIKALQQLLATLPA